MQKRILIVEDEAPIRDMVAFALRRAELDPVHAADAPAAARAIAALPPDLILLDWMLPGLSGLEFARRLRADESTAAIPIIMLTARGEEVDRVSGLEAGVDDYVVKPFSARELVARIRAVLRRVDGGASEVFESAGLRLDAAAQRVSADGVAIKLAPAEYRLLHFFITHAERVHSRERLLDCVWGNAVCVEVRTVDAHVRRLRRALEPFALAWLIQTVRGSGYRFSNAP